MPSGSWDTEMVLEQRDSGCCAVGEGELGFWVLGRSLGEFYEVSRWNWKWTKELKM